MLSFLLRQAFLLLMLGAVAAGAEGDPTFKQPFLIRFDGMITPQTEQYFNRKLAAAKRQGADLVIVEIDSPGGYVEQSLAMAEKLQRAPFRTVAYIPREAISGAALMSLGCDEIIMAPGAHMGDAGPVVIGPDAAFRHAPEKIRSYLAQKVRGLCEASDRPPALGEAMVDQNLVVFRMKNRDSGELKLLSQPEINELPDPGQWEKVSEVAESREGSFLMVNGRRALELGLIEGLADDRDALYQRFQLERDPIILRPTAVDTAVTWLNWWVISLLLIAVGLIALYVELSAPGISVGGLVSGLCFALFFWSRFLGGTAGWLEVLLFVAGLAFVAIEIFVIPGFGAAGVLGLGMITASVIFAGQDFWIPGTWSEVRVTTTTVFTLLGAGIAFSIGAVLISRHLGSLPVLSQLVLKPPQMEEAPLDLPKDGKASVVQAHGEAYQVGDWGVAISPLRPAGKIEVGDLLLDVTSEGGFIEQGTQVKIVQIRGNHITVREV